MSLLSEKPFLSFLKRRGVWKILLVAAVGVLILAFAGQGKTEAADPLETYRAALEERVAEMCSSVKGVGRTKVMVAFSSGWQTVKKSSGASSEIPPEVLSVTVVCEGGGNDATVLALREMLSAAFGIPKSRVSVMKLK